MALDFMMPPQGVPGELPPGMPQFPPEAVATPVPPPQVQQAPVAAPATPPEAAPMQAVQPQVLAEEGGAGGSPDGLGFFDKLRTDPKLSQAMMMVGLRMMQGQKPGQDAAGMIGDAMMAGATAHNMLKFNEAENARKDAEFGLKKEEAGVRMDGTRANTAQTLQETSQKAELFPQTKQKVAEELRKLRLEGRKAEADALAAEFKSDPKRLAQGWNLDVAGKQANINQSNAAAGANNALTADRELSTSLKKELLDPKTTPERKKQIQEMHQADDPASRSVTAKQDADMKLVRMANPGWTEQQVAQEVVQMGTTAKANYLALAQKIVENADGAYTPEQVADARAYGAGQVSAQAKRVTGATPAAKPTAGTRVKVATAAEWEKLTPGTPYETADGKQGVR